MDMDQVTTGAVPEDEELERFGYRQQFVRSLRHFESFAVAFSFISITTGIFTTYGFALATGGTRAIWTWPIVVVGQALVALVYGALSVRVPLSGYSYQWASRLANVSVGWWFGWMSFAFLTIVTVSVDYGLVQVAFQPLIGETYTPTSAALETLVVLALQAALIIASTRVTTRVNNTAVATEIIGIVGLTVLLLIVAAVRSLGHWHLHLLWRLQDLKHALGIGHLRDRCGGNKADGINGGKARLDELAQIARLYFRRNGGRQSLPGVAGTLHDFYSITHHLISGLTIWIRAIPGPEGVTWGTLDWRRNMRSKALFLTRARDGL